jgi:cytochrome c-type biogenesis protein CcmH/NrfF
MVGGSLRILWLLPPLKLVAMILLKVALNTKKFNNKNQQKYQVNNTYLQSLARTHTVLVIGVYELLGNPTT